MTNQSRVKYIDELNSFISSKQNIINSVFDFLGWTEESMNDDIKVRCPINPGHWIPESSLPHHKEVCEWVKDGYLKEDLEKIPPDSAFFYEKSANVIPILIDQSTQEKILSESGLSCGSSYEHVPRTVDRWTVQFNPEQRLATYNYVVNASKAAEKSQNVSMDDLLMDFEKKDEQDDKPKSQLEILAEMRDYKRRRQSYRAKNVHITKKSYTEIMKEVIENQTNYLVETRKHEDPEDLNKDHEESNKRRRKHAHNADYDSPDDDASKSRDHYSEQRRHEDSSKHYHSRHKSSKHSHKRKKHKKDRSRSRSSSRHKHKKSHK